VTLPAALTVVLRVLNLKPWTDEVKILVVDHDVADALSAYLPAPQRQEAIYRTSWGSIILRICSISETGTEAIVNASNQTLTLGGGVSYAIRQAAANSLQAKMHSFPIKNDGMRLFPGEAVYTFNDGIPNVRYIIHVNAIRGTEEVLTKSIDSCLEICRNLNVVSVAFPALGAGTGGMKLQECARIFASSFGRIPVPAKTGIPSTIVIALWSIEAFTVFNDAFTHKFRDTLMHQ
jgi:O-acetyl-ADP-ribose deacetylase (regulator of RNase III)